MKILKELFDNISYIDGITIINVEGEILFTAKFNNKLNDTDEIYEVVGKNFREIYPELNSESSTMLQAMELEKPIFIKDQKLLLNDNNFVTISSLSIPIRYHGRIVGVIDLSTEKTKNYISKKYEEIPLEFFKDNHISNLTAPDSYIKYTLQDIITNNVEMLRTKKFVKEICNSDLPVIICGETGTGKELFAHSLHSESYRKNKPFIVQNCSAIPESLFESLFFGSVKGAFTDSQNSAGLFELANGGTLFLDEINSMPLHLQAKLLRVIQDKKFSRLGSKEIVTTNVRIIVALNRDPINAIESNELRSDLYFRLSAMKIEILPLRKRKEDISLLSKFFISKYNKIFHKNIKKVSLQVYKKLEAYHWPGNVRELENVILFGVCMADDGKEILELSDINIQEKEIINDELEEDTSLQELVQAYEKEIIENSLKKYNYNISKTANYLKTPRQTLHRKIKNYNL